MISKNEHYRALFKYFQNRFPRQTESLFKLVASNKLKRINQKETLESISPKSAVKLQDMFANLSEEHLVELTFHINDAQMGKCYQEVFGNV